MALPHTYTDLRSGLGGRGALAALRVTLASRSRVTNLGVVLLAAALVISLLFNMRRKTLFVELPGMEPQEAMFPAPTVNLRMSLPPLRDAMPLSHLIVVAGHAVWTGSDAVSANNDSAWVLEDYQRGGSAHTFVRHIEEGVRLANADSTSLLVFSGGQTRDQAWTTEAESYFRLALALPHPLPQRKEAAGAASMASKAAFQALNADTATATASGASAAASPALPAVNVANLRMTTEAFALDSLQNLLFSIGRFYEFTGSYPEKITVVGYEFKRERFQKLHARALRWPTTKVLPGGTPRFRYVGINDDEPRAQSLQGDRAYALFEYDMYGCHGKLLEKRRHRNAGRRLPPYTSTAKEMAGLLDWCPADHSALQGLYLGYLPWDPRVRGSGIGRGAQAVLDQNGGKFVKEEFLDDGKSVIT
ncbi:hypothetical protein MSPP1_001603 [Malassezia sp. CBS 17886]|nr:hypothetical protein MSPP1_001603 [Malassezia sp. CBS 17886]